MNTKEKIEIMQAYLDGKLIQFAENSISHTVKLKSQSFIRIPEFDKTHEIEVEE